VYFPSGQAEHTVALLLGCKLANSKPGSHRQSLPLWLPCLEKEFGSQGKHPFPPVLSAQLPGRATPKEFASQGLQPAVESRAKPTTHTHAAAFVLPAVGVVALLAHVTQSADPVLSLYVPTGHASQLECEASPE